METTVSQTSSSTPSSIYDFFVSYKHRDTAAFATRLKAALEAFEADVWLDNDNMHPGDSVLSGIEDGIRNSIDAIVILSKHYFTGWSDAERSSLYALMVSKRLRMVPIWYRLTDPQIQELAPMFAGIVAITVNNGSEKSAIQTATTIMRGYARSQRRNRLFDLFFQAVARHVSDPDIDLFLAVSSNDTSGLKRALNAGANVNVTDTALWNRYNRIIIEHRDVFPAWRRLFMYLHEQGTIG